MKYSPQFFMIGAAFCLVLLISAGILLFSSVSRLANNRDKQTQNYQVYIDLEETLSVIQDAETGQRGYLLTGGDQYLEPYRTASQMIDQKLTDLRTLVKDDPVQQQHLNTLTPLIQDKFAEIQQTIDVRRSQGFQAALQLVLTDQGKQVMDNIRRTVADMENTTRSQITISNQAVAQATQTTLIVAILTSVFGVGFLFVALLQVNRELQQRIKTEIGLRDARNTLETRVLERTAQLASVNEQQQLLSEASRVMVMSLDYRATLQRLAHLLVPGLADWCVIEVYDPDPSKAVLVAVHVEPEKVALIHELRRRNPVDPASPNSFWEGLRNFKSSLTPAISDEMLAASAKNPEELEFMRKLGFKSVIVAPLITDSKLFGTLSLVSSTSGRIYTADHLQLVEELATRTALAVENSRLYEEAQQARHIAQRNADRIARYQSVLAALSEAISPVQVADIIVKQGTGALGAVAGAVGLLSTNGAMLELLSTTGYAPDTLDEWTRAPLSKPSPITDAVRTGQPVWLCSVEEARARYPDIAWERPGYPRGSWAAIPFAIRGQIVGGISLSFSDPQPFENDDRAFLIGLAQKCAQAWDRTRLTAEIWEQREQFRVTLSSIGDAVIATDSQGHITFMNPVAEELTGWSSSRVNGKPLAEVFNIINETTRDTVENPFMRVMHEGSVVGLANHTLLITKDAKELPIDDSGAPILDEHGQIKGVVLVFRNVTERRRQEVELETTLQRTQDLYETCHHIGIVYEADEILRAQFTSRYLHHASQAAIAIFDDVWAKDMPDRYTITTVLDRSNPVPGLQDDHTVQDSPIARLFSKTTPVFIDNVQTDPRIDLDQRAILQGSQVMSLVIYPLTARGQCFGMLIACFAEPNHWTNDDHRHILTFVEQISVALDNIRLMEDEKRARQEAEQANRLKLKFLAMISHELRTPLTSIKGFATTLLATDVVWDAASQREFVTIINEEANKLTDLIEQILDLSRIQAGHLRIQPSPCTVDQLIEKAWPQLAVITAQHQLHLQCAEAFPPILCDMVRMAQVLVNLVGNAAKYSPVGTPITISCARQVRNLQISVSDLGRGIPVEDREKVFEAFSQLESSDTQKTKGAGLGLAICKGLVEAHQGHIWIETQPGPGTTITFTIPFAKPEPALR